MCRGSTDQADRRRVTGLGWAGLAGWPDWVVCASGLAGGSGSVITQTWPPTHDTGPGFAGPPTTAHTLCIGDVGGPSPPVEASRSLTGKDTLPLDLRCLNNDVSARREKRKGISVAHRTHIAELGSASHRHHLPIHSASVLGRWTVFTSVGSKPPVGPSRFRHYTAIPLFALCSSWTSAEDPTRSSRALGQTTSKHNNQDS